jgi:hypothetical protein
MAAGLVDEVLQMTNVVALINAANSAPAVRSPYMKRVAEKISN